MSGAYDAARNMLQDASKKRSQLGRMLNSFYNYMYVRISRAELSYVTRLIVLVSVGLAFFGSIMVLSASSVRMISQGLSPFNQGERQAEYALGGLVLMLVVGFIPVHLYRRRWVFNTAIVLGILLQLAVLVVGVEVGGNRNWIVLGPVQIQPSELSKPILVLWLALMLTRQGDVSRDSGRALFPALFGFVPLVFAIMAGNDLGTVIVYGFIFLGMLWLAGTRARMMWMIIGTALAGAALAVFTSANRIQRIFGLAGVCNGAACDQANSGKVALATGGFLGVGLGQSRQKYNYLPEAHNDYIFAIIGEELGLLGTLAVVLLYLGLIYCAVTIMVRTSDRFVRLASGGIMVWITVQALVNMGMVSGVLPVIGVPLPFISYGGSSLLASMFAAGLLFAFSRQTPVYPVPRGRNRNLSPREIRRENDDWQRRLSLGKVVAEENRQIQQAGGALGFNIRSWGEQLQKSWRALVVWLGLTSEQRARTQQYRVHQRQQAQEQAQLQRRRAEEQRMREAAQLRDQVQAQRTGTSQRAVPYARETQSENGQQLRVATQHRGAPATGQQRTRRATQGQHPATERGSARTGARMAGRPQPSGRTQSTEGHRNTAGRSGTTAAQRAGSRQQPVPHRGSAGSSAAASAGRTGQQRRRTPPRAAAQQQNRSIQPQNGQNQKQRSRRTGAIPEGLRPLHGGATGTSGTSTPPAAQRRAQSGRQNTSGRVTGRNRQNPNPLRRSNS